MPDRMGGTVREYLPKNQNEYILEGNRVVEKIRTCECLDRHENDYILECRIHQRGRHEYRYSLGNRFISKCFNNNRVFFLSDEAQDTVMAAIARYQKKIEETKNWRGVTVPCGDSAVDIRYHPKHGGVDYFLAYNVREKRKETFYESLDAIHWLLCDLANLLHRNSETAELEKQCIAMQSSAETIGQNPVYAAAIKQGDEMFSKLLKLHYGIADLQEQTSLSDCLGWRILPALPEFYNRDYYVKADTIGADDYLLLKRSGYKILHRPYFGMKGSTHSMFTLNPNKKVGIDAAPIGEVSVSFQEYLTLFEGDNAMNEDCVEQHNSMT